MKPRELLFHEGGHALHHLDDSAAFSTKLTPSQEAARKQLEQLEQLYERRSSYKSYKLLAELEEKLIPSPHRFQQLRQRSLGLERIANNS